MTASRGDPSCETIDQINSGSSCERLPILAALLFSVLLLIGGKARLEGFPDLTVGLLGSVYFAGMLTGTLAAPAIIRSDGHIRGYAAFVALAVVFVVLMPVLRWRLQSCQWRSRGSIRRPNHGVCVPD